MPDEIYGREFCSKRDARAEIDRLFAEGKIMGDEKKFLHDQISEQKDLAPTEEFAGMRARLKCEILNELEDINSDLGCDLDEDNEVRKKEVVH